jgi:hypothetical protein
MRSTAYSSKTGLFYRNLHRERPVRPARKCAVNIDFVRFGFCLEGVAAPVFDETFDIKGHVALCPLKDANRRGLPGACGEGIASERRVGARGATEGRCRCAQGEADRRALWLIVGGYGKGAEEDSRDGGMAKHEGILATSNAHLPC